MTYIMTDVRLKRDWNYKFIYFKSFKAIAFSEGE